MSDRRNRDNADWPLRPWLMAAIVAVAGLAFEALADPSGNASVSALRQAGATLVAVSAISFVIIVERARWQWAAGFALAWGGVVALVGWFTASYNRGGEIFEFPFLSGIFAVLLAAPLFQTVRDERAWRFPYPRLYAHASTDAVIGAISLAFVGVTFLLAWLIAGLFDLIGIAMIKDLLREAWFGWMLAGFAFGAAAGLLRERDQMAGSLLRLAMVVLGVLAPVLAAALAMFLLSIPFTGLGDLWESSIPATSLMLTAGAGAVLLANAVIGDGSDEVARGGNRVLSASAMVLILSVLPLALIAALSLGQRVGQHGWTPERMWGAVAVAVALIYGAVGWWAVARQRARFANGLRSMQTRLAIGLCGAALFLALPIVDFGAVSARSQMARLASGQVKADAFDWRAMAFEFGPAGRRRLSEIATAGPAPQRGFAAAALASKDRYAVETNIAARASEATIDQRLRVVPQDARVPNELRAAVAQSYLCRTGQCVVVLINGDEAVIAGTMERRGGVQSMRLVRTTKGAWVQAGGGETQDRPMAPFRPDLGTARVEVREVKRRQLTIDGRAVGDAFE